MEQAGLGKSSSWIPVFVLWFGAGSVLLHIAAVTLFPVDPFVLRSGHVACVSILFFIGSMANKEGKIGKGWIFNLIFALASIAAGVYIFLDYSRLYYRVAVNPTQWDVVIGLVCIVTLIELTRRMMGWALPIIAISFILYALFGSALPGVFGHRGYSFETVVSFLFSLQGIYGSAVQASAALVLLFVTLGAFLSACGTGDLFINLGMALTGRIRGGPAKVSVISSSLFGMISGSAVANVTVDGVITIPMMKKYGYKKEYASAVEAVASTGGQIMPPVMGTAAFIMAEFLGIPYAQIAISAFIPAILYYLAVFLNVDFEAIRLGLKGLPSSGLPRLGETLKKQGYLFFPILVLVYFLLVVQSSTIRAGLIAIASAILVSYLRRPSWITPSKFVAALSEGMTGVIGLAAACATAGIIVGVLTLTGLGLRMASIILSIAGNNLFLTLILTMIISLVLGIGLPTAPSYIIAASVAAPALIKLGVAPLAAHLFVFYFAVLSTITPPECHAAFSAAAIGGADPMKTGFVAFKLGLSALIVPFAFAYDDVLLLNGTFGEILLAIGSAVMGIYALARATSHPGHHPVERAVLLVASVLLIMHGRVTDLLGILLLILGHSGSILNALRRKNQG
jgi:TRAP transporter 4TM/12TM fusion protein